MIKTPNGQSVLSAGVAAGPHRPSSWRLQTPARSPVTRLSVSAGTDRAFLAGGGAGQELMPRSTGQLYEQHTNLLLGKGAQSQLI